MGEAETHSTVAHPQLFRNLAKACSFGTQPPYFVVIHGAAGTTKLLPTGPRIAEACVNALTNQVAFQLGHGRHNDEEGLPQRAARINVFLIADELDSERTKLLQCKKQMLRGPGETVKAPHHNRIKLPLGRSGK